jgi:hypothetical protein
VSLDKENLAKIKIPVVHAHGGAYPTDKNHSAKDAFDHASNNLAVGSTGMFLHSEKSNGAPFGYEYPYENVGQIWMNGKWLKDSRDGTDTGEKFPTLGEWIHSIIESRDGDAADQ